MTLKVFYDDRQNASNNVSFSPSAGKPKLVVEEWKKKGYDFSLGEVKPVTREDFQLAHHDSYVNGILDLKRPNGFGNTIPEVAAALPWTTGSLLEATKYALYNHENACSPTSGFHHAHWARAEGFCTFNGLMVTAMKLKQEGYKLGPQFIGNQPLTRIGILDIDHHYGNGTNNIIAHHKIDYVAHYTFGMDSSNYYWKGGEKAEKWLKELPEVIDCFDGCEVVIYQAGADPHVDDPYGGALTDAQLRERDRIVFTKFKAMHIPVVWNLAGGYQTPIQKVLDIHNATMEECLKVM